MMSSEPGVADLAAAYDINWNPSVVTSSSARWTPTTRRTTMSSDLPLPTTDELAQMRVGVEGDGAALEALADWLFAKYGYGVRHDVHLLNRTRNTMVAHMAMLERLHDEIERLRAANKGLLELASEAYVPPPTRIVDFAKAKVHDHAYTWERADGFDFGEYRFETAGDPRDLYDDDEGGAVIRKRWMLVEVTELPAGSREG